MTSSASASFLVELAAELVAVPSVSHEEGALADLVEARLSSLEHLEVLRLGDNVVARTATGRSGRLVVAGHLDTVPPAGNAAPQRRGDELWGVGSADMKGTLAVMLALAPVVRRPPVDVTWCFYAREEVGRQHSGLLELFETRPDLLEADAAILGEPTDARVEAGCQGTMRLAVHLAGARAHTARPFMGRNAIHRLAPVLAAVAGWPGREVLVEGCCFVEQLQAVAVEGGVAGNVVPDHASVILNHRFAPDRDPEAAEVALRELLAPVLDEAGGDRMETLDVAAGAPPALATPLLADLVARSGAPPRAKVGWTDVATFWSHGVPAANFGAGDPRLAHHRDERVTAGSLVAVHRLLGELLGAEP